MKYKRQHIMFKQTQIQNKTNQVMVPEAGITVIHKYHQSTTAKQHVDHFLCSDNLLSSLLM